MVAIHNLGLIIKATRKCNLRCAYCHDWRARSRRMSLETLARMTSSALSSTGNGLVEFIWHGGEPLLLGQRFFERAVALQQALRRPRQRIRNSLQTNATTLTEQWCDFFAEHKFDIGVSLDGPAETHDFNRAYANGRPSFEDVKRGIGLLRSRGLPFGLLVVVNEAVARLDPRFLFDTILGLGATSFAFLPVRPDNDPEADAAQSIHSEYLTADAAAAFMTAMFDVWYAHNDPAIRIREFSSLLATVLGKRPTVCTLAGSCIGQYFHVEANGDVYHCDKYVGDPNYLVGNINDSGFDEIRASEKLARLLEQERLSLSKIDCEYSELCNGGCPHDRYIASRYGGEVKCCGQRHLIRHISCRVERELAPALESVSG